MEPKVQKSLDDWRSSLTPAQFTVCRLGGTEPPGSGKYDKHYAEGVYRCSCCQSELFRSDSKFNSGTGWPSFFQPAAPGALKDIEDLSHGMRRIEVRCAHCDAHLGHVFPDGPKPTGMRYCINSVSLDFTPATATAG